MTETLDNIKLDNTNVKFNEAAELVHTTDKLVYLTGLSKSLNIASY